MTGRKVVVDPVTRIEGHLRVETQIENGQVTDARCSADMFRGIEAALVGYDARVAQQVTQRVCGVCPYAHAEAASLALENAMGLRPNRNGQLLRNLIVGAYQLQDYLLHFYTLCALDFIDITAVLTYQGRDAALSGLRDWVRKELASGKVFPAAPFLPRYQAVYVENPDTNLSAIKSYVDALPVMADLHKMVAIFGAKAPHPTTIEAGGVTTRPTVDMIMRYEQLLERVAPFIEENFRRDLLGVAAEFPSYFHEGKGYANLLSFPYLPEDSGENFMIAGGVSIAGQYQPLDIGRITEDHRFSYYSDQPDAGRAPGSRAALTPIDEASYKREHAKPDGKYSWSRAPRYGGEVMEVGPAARLINTYRAGINPTLNALVDRTCGEIGIGHEQLVSVLGRHTSRWILAKLTLDTLRRDIQRVKADELAFIERDMPKNASGVGLTEATRGALGHWIETDDKGLIRRYEMVVPTTWNLSPRDAAGRPGAVEQMLIGTRVADSDNPMELARIVRSSDPCMACSVH